MSGSIQPSNKILELRSQRTAADEPISQVALSVRSQLSLLLGYADIMEGVSPQLKKHILQMMAEKTRELGSALQPFLEPAPAARPAIGAYRRVRERTRHLISELS